MSRKGDKWYDGTGSLIDKCGLILTNWHVVQKADEVSIIFKPKDGVELEDAPYYNAKVLSVNKNLDLALLQIPKPPRNLKIIPVGTSKFVNVGSKVHAIGHPNGLYWSYTQGYISQVRKNLSGNMQAHSTQRMLFKLKHQLIQETRVVLYLMIMEKWLV